MTPLAHALDVLQGEQGTDVTSGNLLPTIFVIRDAFKTMRNESELLIAESLLNSVNAGFLKRFDHFLKNRSTKYLEANLTNDLSILNEYPNIKTLNLQYNTGFPGKCCLGAFIFAGSPCSDPHPFC